MAEPMTDATLNSIDTMSDQGRWVDAKALTREYRRLRAENGRLRAAADAGHELSMWAAAINWDGCPNEGEWLAGLRDRIEAAQAAYREATETQGGEADA